MSSKNRSVKIKWSIWDKSPLVSWDYNGNLTSVNLRFPPIAVSLLSSREIIAIVGDFDEFFSGNLLLYSYNGMLQKVITAPPLGEKSQFGGVSESDGKIDAIIGYKTDDGWQESAGLLNLDNGEITNLHRNY